MKTTGSCALFLLAGVVGAGFASGREIARFFAGHGAGWLTAALCACGAMLFFFLRLCAQMERRHADSLGALCAARLGMRFGCLCGGLFFLLFSVTGGAMLAACAELCALTIPLHNSYGAGMALTLALACTLTLCGMRGLSLCGGALSLALPALLVRLLLLPQGEACFLPAMAPDLPVRAAADGAVYGALNTAMLSGMLPALLALPRRLRRQAALAFSLLFFLLLTLGCAVCLKHLPFVLSAPMPFVALSRSLGAGGYLCVAFCLYAASLSTLCAMLGGMQRMMRLRARCGVPAAALLCLLLARAGFGPIISAAYPVLGAVCAGLLLVLCA